MEAATELARLREALEQATGEGALAELDELCAQMADGWCMWVLETMQASLRKMLQGELWQAVTERGGLRGDPSPSLVDLFTQLDQVASVYVAFAAPQSLPSSTHQQFLDLIETQVSQYVMMIVSGCGALPISVLQQADVADAAPDTNPFGQQQPRGGLSAIAEHLTNPFGVKASRVSPAEMGNPWEQAAEGASTNPWAERDETDEHWGVPRKLARQQTLEEQPLAQLLVRLSNCQGAIHNLEALGSKLRNTLPALAELPGTAMADGERMCETACRDLVEYVSAKLIFYELEPSFVAQLYVPTPNAAGTRLDPCLLQQLRPLVDQIREHAPQEWRQPLLEGLLASFSRALGAALELPGRHFQPEHMAVLHEDLEALGSFFCSLELDMQLVGQTLNFLYAVVEQRCAAKG